MVRRWVFGLLAAAAVGTVGIIAALPGADAHPAQSPAGEFVKCPVGEVCLAPAATLERD